MSAGSEKYQANRGEDNNDKLQPSDSSKKFMDVGTKAVAGKYGGKAGSTAFNALSNTKPGQKALELAALSNDHNPIFKKAAEILDKSGALDAVDKIVNEESNLDSDKDDLKNDNKDDEEKKSGKSDSDDSKKADKSKTIDIKEDIIEGNFKKKLIIIAVIAAFSLVFIIFTGFFIILSGSDETGKDPADSENSAECIYTQNADESTKKEVRYTTYVGASLGGTLGNINQYVKEGIIYYENGIAMWKGGNKSKLNGKVYGESGKNYIIVATATNYLIGSCATSGCRYKWQSDSRIKYFEYGDTFTIAISFDNNNTYNNYDAIVLDSCGACMEWSLSYPKTSLYSPKSTLEVNRCKKSEGYKIDIYRREDSVNIPSDMGFIMAGSSSNICIGQVDLGTLVIGTGDTKMLQGKMINDLYGGIDNLNNLINSNVEKNGKGTGNGVAAAAITLINSLKEKGYRIPYYWGGGHGDAITSLGVNPNLGSNTAPSCSSTTCYYYKGFDCSGFVSWAIKNGACPNFSPLLAKNFMSLGKTVPASMAKPGDVQASSGHVRLVVQNNNGNLVLAESSGGTGGVHFSNYNQYDRGYVFVDMSNYYSSSRCK